MIRARTELQCTVEDLRLASERAGGRREELSTELTAVEFQIAEKEKTLQELKPEWEALRSQENEERRELDGQKAKLESLFAKRGRMDRFRTKGERDRYLMGEIASVDAYRTSQDTALQAANNNLVAARTSLGEIEERLGQAQDTVEDGREQMRKTADELSKAKDKHSTMSEKRKTLWREETRLRSVVDNLGDELRSAERLLASMMDKVSLRIYC